MSARRKTTTQRVRRASIVPAEAPIEALGSEIRELILSAREQVAHAVNAGLTMLYWRIGARIRLEILKEKRAEYGRQIVRALSAQLEVEFGRGFSEKSLRHMLRFAEVFPDRQIVSALLRQLSWSHFLAIIYMDDPLRRDFYAEMCRMEHWSTRTLAKRIQSMLFERTALSRKPGQTIEKDLTLLRQEDRLTPDLVFRDPYVLDFLGLKDSYGEKDLESAILREMESFILELGTGFAFVERQKRMQIDNRDYYLDLLFYHRKLRRLVAIELKIGDFEAGDKGQMELYLGWLKRYAHEADEEPPLGVILCAGKSEQHVELLELEKSGIHVARYLTKVLPKKELERKLHDVVRFARTRLGKGRLRKGDSPD